MPHFARWLLGRDRLQGARDRAERKRQGKRRPHEVTFYHRADDPHSHLLAQALPAFLERYPVTLRCVTVASPDTEAVRHPEMWSAWGLRDARELADRYLLPSGATLQMPPGPPCNIDAVHGALERADDYLKTALDLGTAAWRGQTIDGAGPTPGLLDSNRQELNDRGHYLPGMLHYEGEWYWGVDRLPWLEERLAELGVGEGTTLTRQSVARPTTSHTLEVWGSVRSPYTYLALERLYALVEEYDLKLVLRPILPMVMRGIPAPRVKRMYIVRDAKRIADRNGTDFGFISDPLGAGVERVLAWLPRAREQGKEGELLLAAMRGIWAEGVEVATDAGLKQVVESVGLEWDKTAVRDERWRDEVEVNRQALVELGLWGVPSFRIGDYTGWGQDRLWVLEDRLRAARELARGSS